jgi:hypothetical protein
MDVWVHMTNETISLGRYIVKQDNSDTNILCDILDKLTLDEIQDLQDILLFASDDDFMEGISTKKYIFRGNSSRATACRLVRYSYIRGLNAKN